jgi:tetratricopeptide (TPR) repeat protein
MKFVKKQIVKNTISVSIALWVSCAGSGAASVGKPPENQWLQNFYCAAREIDQKHYKEAHRELMKCLDQIGHDPIKALTTLSLLERLFEEIGDSDSMEKVLKVHLQVLKGYQFPQESYAHIYMQLAEIYGAQENYQKAQSYLTLSIPLVKKANGEYSVETGVALNNLAYAELKLGKYESAEKHYKQSLDAFARSQGIKSLFYAFTASNLGDYYEQFGKLKLASEYFERALDAFVHTLGSAHTLAKETRTHLDEVRKKLGPENPSTRIEIPERKQAPKPEDERPSSPAPWKRQEPGRFSDLAHFCTFHYLFMTS